MPVREPTKAIREELARLRTVADGAVTKRLRNELAKKALDLAVRGFRARTSPEGRPWKPSSMPGAGDLQYTGRIRASMAVELTERGFALTDKAVSPKGVPYAGTQQYGRTIRPKGLERVWKKSESGEAVYRTLRSGRSQRVGVGYKKTAGAQPMKWKSADGRWHSAWKVRIPARPFFPKYGRIPTAWKREFEAVIEQVTAAHARGH